MFQRPNGHTHHDFYRDSIVSRISHQLPCKLQLPSPQAINHPLTGRSTLYVAGLRGSQSDRDGSARAPRPSAWLWLCGSASRRQLCRGREARGGRRPAVSALHGQPGSVGAAAPGRRGRLLPPSMEADNGECY